MISEFWYVGLLIITFNKYACFVWVIAGAPQPSKYIDAGQSIKVVGGARTTAMQFCGSLSSANKALETDIP